ncbi:hypothetical protein [Streptomyces sp. NPDC059371]|uniref:hypothetical protein n=1 Tax=Streptomyces sp. NPDC059371 TaxID=3346812 RepID=UPI0036B94D8D
MMADGNATRALQQQQPVHSGDKSPTHTGGGNQFITFVEDSWVQVLALMVVAAGAVIEIVMAPEASAGQHVFYGVLVVLCAITASLCLWFACEWVRKKFTASLVLVVGAVLSASIAAGCYKVLADHGDLTVPVTVKHQKPLADKDQITADIVATPTRSHVRVRITLPDHYPTGTCVASAHAEVAARVDGMAQKPEAVTLMSGQTGDINLHGARRDVELTVVIHAGEGCLMDLAFEPAVLHDDEWWLP